MCGLAGILERPGAPADTMRLRAMTDSLRHRGPDASGFHVDDNVGLGHRRLSIIDVSEQANQPLFNEDRSVAVIFNGEIYNHQELRERLESHGHVFQTRTDTEVLVHGWEQYGASLVDHLNGMFAFAVYDSKTRTLFLARDRLGQKPLFYHSDGTRFLFGSEIKAIRAFGGIDTALDLQALVEYTAYGYPLGERTIFQAIRELPPAHTLTLSTASDTLQTDVRRYWDVHFEPDYGPSEDEWVERLDESLDRAVQRRLMSDVPLGTFLSGGIDSSLITAYAAKHKPGLQTFCIGFHEPSYDESRYAAEVARHLGTDHHVEYVTPDALEILPELVATYDEPFADSSAIPTWYLSRMTRQHVTVALSGDGGDELHAGYRRYARTLELNRFSSALTRLGRSGARQFSRMFPSGSRQQYILDALSRQGSDLYDFAMGWNERHLSLLHRDVRAAVRSWPPGGQESAFRRGNGSPLASKLQYVDLMNYLPEDILVKVDRASMAHSLEARSPMLDVEFVELAARIPSAHQRRNGSKSLLKQLALRHIPISLIHRPKMGFGVPLDDWFRNQLRPALENALADATAVTWQYFDRETVQQRFQRHLSDSQNLQSSLWRVFYFHSWTQSQLAGISTHEHAA